MDPHPTFSRRGSKGREAVGRPPHRALPCVSSLQKNDGAAPLSTADGSLPTRLGHPQSPSPAGGRVKVFPSPSLTYIHTSCLQMSSHPATLRKPLCSLHSPSLPPLFPSVQPPARAGPSCSDSVPLCRQTGSWHCSCCPHSPVTPSPSSSAPCIVCSEPDLSVPGELGSGFFSQHRALRCPAPHGTSHVSPWRLQQTPQVTSCLSGGQSGQLSVFMGQPLFPAQLPRVHLSSL